jgi:hypothetical protein
MAEAHGGDKAVARVARIDTDQLARRPAAVQAHAVNAATSMTAVATASATGFARAAGVDLIARRR